MKASKITKDFFITEDGEKIFFAVPFEEVPDINVFNQWIEKIEDVISSPFDLNGMFKNPND